MRHALALVVMLAACGGEPEAAPVPEPAEDAARPVTLASFEGSWAGTLEVGAQALPLVLNVDGDAVTLDSPAQGAFGLAAEASVADDALVARWPMIGATYIATLSKAGDAVAGPFEQSGQAFRLRMTRTGAPVAVPNRPQAVVGTPPYDVVTGMAEGPAGRLAYTATLPDASGPVPGVVLITGSGPQDRDETIAGHKPFAVLADHLTRAGVAVLRYDDRGVGRSAGTFEGATSRDFAGDAEAALAALRGLAAERGVTLSGEGLLGHSEGGWVAALAATKTDAAPDFVVALAAPFVPMTDVLVRQTEDALALRGADEAQVTVAVATQRRLVEAAAIDAAPEAACDALRDAAAGLPLSTQEEAQALCAPWFYELFRIDPAAAFAGIDVPVLAVFGGRDRQVSAEASVPVAEGLGSVETLVFPDANHLFQTATDGSTAEYARIEETMREDVMEALADWITRQAG